MPSFEQKRQNNPINFEKKRNAKEQLFDVVNARFEKQDSNHKIRKHIKILLHKALSGGLPEPAKQHETVHR